MAEEVVKSEPKENFLWAFMKEAIRRARFLKRFRELEGAAVVLEQHARHLHDRVVAQERALRGLARCFRCGSIVAENVPGALTILEHPKEDGQRHRFCQWCVALAKQAGWTKPRLTEEEKKQAEEAYEHARQLQADARKNN